MSPEHDKKKASKSGLPAMFPTDTSWPLKSLQMPFFTATQGRIAMLVRGDQGGRATVRNARLARRFRAASYELAASLELARIMRNLAAAYTKFNICSARTRWVRLYHH